MYSREHNRVLMKYEVEEDTFGENSGVLIGKFIRYVLHAPLILGCSDRLGVHGIGVFPAASGGSLSLG